MPVMRVSPVPGENSAFVFLHSDRILTSNKDRIRESSVFFTSQSAVRKINEQIPAPIALATISAV